jgi:hypothetical protein
LTFFDHLYFYYCFFRAAAESFLRKKRGYIRFKFKGGSNIISIRTFIEASRTKIIKKDIIKKNKPKNDEGKAFLEVF